MVLMAELPIKEDSVIEVELVMIEVSLNPTVENVPIVPADEAALVPITPKLVILPPVNIVRLEVAPVGGFVEASTAVEYDTV